MKEILNTLIKQYAISDSNIVKIVKLHGDASYRTYYRLVLSDNSTLIVMQMPAGKSSVSEEITNYKGPAGELPFINVNKFLKSLDLPVPKILTYSKEDLLMILEDLGDDLMAKNVEGADDFTRLKWYTKALDLLCRIQKASTGAAKNSCIAFVRSFDATLLNWEFDHFLEYAIEARLGTKMSDNDRATFNQHTREITSKIEKMPYCFTHRDFQSRNLIAKNGDLYLIDFQDALLGPYVYDLVALTRDSYVNLSANIRGKLIRRFSELSKLDLAKVKNDYDLVTIQRKLKDAGRFVYIDRVKGNPNFLKFIPTSLGYVKEALLLIPGHKELYDMLLKYVPEWSN